MSRNLPAPKPAPAHLLGRGVSEKAASILCQPRDGREFPSQPLACQAHRFVLEELGKLVPGLIAVGIALPVVRHVVDVRQDDSQQLLWAKHQVLVGDEGPAGQENVSVPGRPRPGMAGRLAHIAASPVAFTPTQTLLPAQPWGVTVQLQQHPHIITSSLKASPQPLHPSSPFSCLPRSDSPAVPFTHTDPRPPVT